MMDAMIRQLVDRSYGMLLESFLVKFMQTSAKSSMCHKLIADWVLFSNAVSDGRFESLCRQIQDAEFCYAVAKAVSRKTGREWEGSFVPPYMVSSCFYHIRLDTAKRGKLKVVV